MYKVKDAGINKSGIQGRYGGSYDERRSSRLGVDCGGYRNVAID